VTCRGAVRRPPAACKYRAPLPLAFKAKGEEVLAQPDCEHRNGSPFDAFYRKRCGIAGRFTAEHV